MISVITCSINGGYVHELSENVRDTIGVEFEFLPFDNSKLNWGICKVYNEQAKKANGSIICFVHDDARFLTNNWGKLLESSFENDNTLGAIGVAGSGYKTLLTSPWSAAPQKLIALNVIQHYKFKDLASTKLNYNQSSFQEVVVIDGVFMATTKNVLSIISFDEKNLKGFHGYDIDFSLQVGLKYKLIVLNSIEIEHFSEGNTDFAWFEQLELVRKKWSKQLPKSIYRLNFWERERQEYKAFIKTSTIIKKSKDANWFKLLNYYLLSFKFSFIPILFFKNQIDINIVKKIKPYQS